MKTRTDFVSNSSSSSFIMSKPALFEHYSITKNDVEDALVELYGKEAYSRYENGKCRPFTVYELPADLDKALKDYGALLSHWNQTIPIDYENCWIDENGGRATWLFDNFLEAMSKAYDVFLWHGTDDELSHKEGYLTPAAKAVILEVRKRLDVKTAKEVIQQNDAWLFIHFDDNEVWSLDGTTEMCNADIRTYTPPEEAEKAKTSKFTTQHYSASRFIEVLLLKLADKGKLKLDDIDVLAEEYPADAQGTWLHEDKYKPDDLIEESCLHCRMHEG